MVLITAVRDRASVPETAHLPHTPQSIMSAGGEKSSKPCSQPDGKTGQGKKSEMGMTSYKMCVFDQENFQGRCIEIGGECMNVCDMGMDRVRSLRVDCGPFVGYEQMNMCGEMYILEKENTRAGTHGATATRTTSCCPLDLSEWYCPH
ncbi:hypothetical protein SKAU_G00320220 [Synaphobranchus kaupii]|uniref:Beta/gamma crystallin 'Greek key' domain-containing protein n=1 Tax=Synaphobranchus kaupii TaxID=118154 RepID=A0A9Q1ENK5_SYNKA|nr:hypothetical protein SKAU_G00320220 [Synaphobranchus kaupii]